MHMSLHQSILLLQCVFVPLEDLLLMNSRIQPIMASKPLISADIEASVVHVHPQH